MPADESLRQAKFAAKLAHLVLEQFAQRLDELQLHALGQAADIVMRLDRHRRAAAEGDALDHIGIKRALRQETPARRGLGGDLLGLRLEGRDEQPADGLALFLRVADAGQALRNSSRAST